MQIVIRLKKCTKNKTFYAQGKSKAVDIMPKNEKIAQKPNSVWLWEILPVEISVENVENSWSISTKDSDNADQLLKNGVSVARAFHLKIGVAASAHHGPASFYPRTAPQSQSNSVFVDSEHP